MVKRIAYIRTLNNINGFYLNKNMIYFEDGLLNFALYRNVNSLYLLKRIGYYYIFNKKSTSHSVDQNKYLLCFFIFLKFTFENSKNNKKEKNMIYFFLNNYINNNNILKQLTKYSGLFGEIIELLMNNKFCNYENKKKLKIIKNIISNLKKKR